MKAILSIVQCNSPSDYITTNVIAALARCDLAKITCEEKIKSAIASIDP